jgi:hypothetical protein
MIGDPTGDTTGNDNSPKHAVNKHRQDLSAGLDEYCDRNDSNSVALAATSRCASATVREQPRSEQW